MSALKTVACFTGAVIVATFVVVLLMFRDTTAIAALPFALVFSLPFSTIALAPMLFFVSRFKSHLFLLHALAGAAFGVLMALLSADALPKLVNEQRADSIPIYGVLSLSSLYLLVGGIVASCLFWFFCRKRISVFVYR